MSLAAEVTLEWADGTYLFALKAAQIEELQKVCGAGFGVIFRRVLAGEWYQGDLLHTIRLGLIGGGMGAVEAKQLTDTYATPPFARTEGPNSPVALTIAILSAVMIGLEDLPETPQSGEAPAGGGPAT